MFSKFIYRLSILLSTSTPTQSCCLHNIQVFRLSSCQLFNEDTSVHGECSILSEKYQKQPYLSSNNYPLLSVILEKLRFPVTILPGTVILNLTNISLFGKELKMLCRFLQETIFRKTVNSERMPRC